MAWQHLLLNVPVVSFLMVLGPQVLLLFAAMALLMEFFSPGCLIPGICGILSLFLVVFMLDVVPEMVVSFLFLFFLFLISLDILFFMLIMTLVFGLVLFASFGYLGGSLIEAVSELSWGQIIAIELIFIGTGLFFFYMSGRLKRLQMRAGNEELEGRVVVLEQDIDSKGEILVRGEWWQAQTLTPLTKGARVRIKAVEGLVCHIEPYQERDNDR